MSSERNRPDLLQADPALERTYVGSGIAENWDALFATIDIFRGVATEVAGRLDFDYPRELDKRVCGYLERAREMNA
ncbi:MAG: aminoglycoside 6-adenylyltransferase [Candidatus Eisenbacteria bacterium]